MYVPGWHCIVCIQIRKVLIRRSRVSCLHHACVTIRWENAKNVPPSRGRLRRQFFFFFVVVAVPPPCQPLALVK